MWQEILHIDQQLLLALNGSWGPGWDNFFHIVTARLTWVPLYVAVIAADQICNFFKYFTPKLRPSHTPAIQAFVHTVHGYRGGLYGTVSAHAAISFTIALFSLRLFQVKWFTGVILFWAILICYSRIYAGLHFPMDILFGTILGILLGCLAFNIYRKITEKNLHKTPQA